MESMKVVARDLYGRNYRSRDLNKIPYSGAALRRVCEALEELEKQEQETIHENRVIVSDVHSGPFARIRKALQFHVRARAAKYDVIAPFPAGKHPVIIFRYTHSGRYIDSPAKWPQELEIDRFQIWKQAIDKWLD